jgi:positive regulator of sigma E activity
MQVEGVVIGVKEGRVVVRTATEPGCSTRCCSCASVRTCGPEFEALTTQPVEVGARVLVEVPSASAVLSALLVFVLPMLGLVGGVLVGSTGPDKSNTTGLVLGFGLFALFFFAAYVVDRRVVRPRLPEPHVLRVLEPGGSCQP